MHGAKHHRGPSRAWAVYEADRDATIAATKSANSIIIVTSASDREGPVGIRSVMARRSPEPVRQDSDSGQILGHPRVARRPEPIHSQARGDSYSARLRLQSSQSATRQV
ncbi:hypothetical protein CDV31_017354 [Fusarium ambrosium]|uniref:Uncharacterized protein n=1 Tax=Fusarium ambrosium TaxID=131363 RepID=A0A428RH97_9HYPO|nr:hypothetical protein CDV31_017354 [Fusarium ambrosium]